MAHNLKQEDKAKKGQKRMTINDSKESSGYD